jgi:hypothetical protein
MKSGIAKSADAGVQITSALQPRAREARFNAAVQMAIIQHHQRNVMV